MSNNLCQTECWGTDNVVGDPLLADPEGGDFSLLPGSPCIDAADGDAAPELDMNGAARFDDPDTPNTGAGAPPYADIGALEYQGGGQKRVGKRTGCKAAKVFLSLTRRPRGPSARGRILAPS